MYMLRLFPPFASGRFGLYRVLGSLDKAAVINFVYSFLCTYVHILLLVYPGMVLLSHWLWVFSPFVDTSK